MNRSFLPAFKTKEELAAIQLAGLQWTVRHAFEGSPFYRQAADGGRRYTGSDPKS